MQKFAPPNCVISFMNLKGGTGKTTVAIAVAEAICTLWRRRVLLVDCDFQCSASIALLGRQMHNERTVGRRTLDQMVIDHPAGTDQSMLGQVPGPTRFAVHEAATLLEVLPASPEMPRNERVLLSRYLEAQTIGGRTLDTAYRQASLVIAEALRTYRARYDVVILDCPPGLTLFSEAAVMASDYLVVPTLPNEISLAATEHLRREIELILPGINMEEFHIGTVVSKVRHKNAVNHFSEQISSIQRLLDRMHARFAVLQPYLPFCRELESISWREFDTQRVPFVARYGAVSPRIEQLTLALMQRAAARAERRAKVAA